MNVSSLTSYSPLASAMRLHGALATQASTSRETSSARAAEPARRRDEAHLSPMAQLAAKLQKLETSDPAKAKEALTQLAGVVRDQQKTATGDDAQRLGKLADALQTAADTGDLSGLSATHAGGRRGPPPPPPPPAGGASGAVDADGDHDGSASSSVAMRAYAAAAATGGESKGRALMDTLNKTLDGFVASAAASTVSVTA